MSDLQAVVYTDDQPKYELTAGELVFPITIDEYKFFAHMRPYKTAELKKLLQSIQPRYRSSGGNLEVVPGNEERHRPFCDQHLIRLSGVYLDSERTEPTPEQQREWLDEFPHLKAKIVKEGYGLRPLDEPESLPSIGLVISTMKAQDRKVEAEVEMAYVNGEALPEEVTIHLAFHFRRESEADRIAYKRASDTSEINRRSAEWYNKENYEEIERIFDVLILAVDGALIDGQPCVEGNRKDWIGLVPYWYKYQSLKQLFSETRLRN